MLTQKKSIQMINVIYDRHVDRLVDIQQMCQFKIERKT